MSIRARIEDAILLWNSSRREGAFLNALIAVAATARWRYPNCGDRQAFVSFLTDAMPARVNVEYRGKCQPLEYVFYKWLRCELVHEGRLPIDIEFMQGDGLSLRAGGSPEYVLKLSFGWFHHLIGAVTDAPENSQEFTV